MKKNNLIIVLGILFVLTACDSIENKPKERIFSTKFSPDKTVKAIITRYSYGGATGSFVYKIYLTRKDKNISKKILKEPLFFAEKVQDISIKWTNEHTLLLKVKADRIFHYRNFWWNKKTKIMYKLEMDEVYMSQSKE